MLSQECASVYSVDEKLLCPKAEEGRRDER